MNQWSVLMVNIKENLFVIKQRIRDYEIKYHRAPGSVSLLAASKNQTIDKINDAYLAGQTCFGENYLQEALRKMQALSAQAIEWHFIGPMQSNKTRKIAQSFNWVHSVASMKIAQRLNAHRTITLPPLNICIEINTSKEASKSGATPDEARALAAYCMDLPRLKLRGLMTIPAEQHDFDLQRREFNKLCALWDAFRQQGFALDTLSMGMSGDFEAAIAEGATIVRIGTAIFGPRVRAATRD
jgi:pyridoxal phosphate enzyme (YggS family)